MSAILGVSAARVVVDLHPRRDLNDEEDADNLLATTTQRVADHIGEVAQTAVLLNDTDKDLEPARGVSNVRGCALPT